MEHYYEIFVAINSYQKKEPLTYSSAQKLAIGSVVSVPFGRQQAVGFVWAESAKPRFATKAVSSVVATGPLPIASRKLFAWLQTYYPGGSGATAQLFVSSSLLQKSRPAAAAKKETSGGLSQAIAGNMEEAKLQFEPTILPPPTAEQTAAMQVMDAAANSDKRHFLLHGDTGSGKTRVYIERTRYCLSQGKSAIILTPEIALTPQIAQSFTAQFGSAVLILHSALTPKARRESWRKILASNQLGGKPVVIIGPRSALFAPLAEVGLIVADEMHEPAYKQEQAPRYQALRVAGALAKIHNAELIYGSATPPVTEYYLAEATHTPILRMQAAARGTTHPAAQITVVDLKDRSAFSRNRYLANTLLEHITASLSRGEQALVFLNRRGTAKLVICQNCGWQALCPNCDLPLTYHGDSHSLRCHTCGLIASVPLNCPECSSPELLFRNIGTKALVSALEIQFPQARIQRFDTDVASDEQFQKHFERVQAGEVDILVGTQMLAKGLDLPRLSTVGVVSADTSLYLPDYTAAERSYQLLYQVLGRVGRGHRAGHVVVQTFSPDNAILQAAIKRDWADFYAAQILERKAFFFPPFCYVLKLSVSRKSPEAAQKAAERLHASLLQAQTTAPALRIQLSEPMPRFFEHTHGQFHWQLIAKAVKRGELIRAIQALPPGDWVYDLDPANLL